MDIDLIELDNPKQLSYLRARDPSIITGNRVPNLKHLKVNLAADALRESSSLDDGISKEPTLRNIQIYLRVKHADDMNDLYELDGNTIHCLVPEGSYGSRNVKHGQYIKRTYTFSHIFGPTMTQEEVFNRTVKPKLLDLLNGQNSTLMTYGASGSGKTFTIVGTASDPGVIPRALEYLFGSLPSLSECPRVKPTATGAVTILTGLLSDSEKNARNMLLTTLSATIDKQHIHTYKEMQQRLSSEPVAEVEQYKDVSIAVWVSFAEIYNEQVYDLLAPDPLKGKPRTKLQLGKSNEKTYIKNLTNINVSNGLEAYQILQYGLHNLKYAATAINSHSSRSHCIFTIKLVQAIENEEDSYLVSYFNFCDLAGSERSKKTLNAGDRLKESNNINTSLMVLGRCISSIRDSQLKNDCGKLIPFRDSKLTMLFQRALSGKEDIAMIVNINPSLEMFDETAHVLNFSAIAKQIAIKSDERKDLKPKKQIEEVVEASSELQEENAKLRELVIDLHNELEHVKSLHEDNMMHVMLDYRKIINDMREDFTKRLKEREVLFAEEKQMAIEMVREEYEGSQEQEPKRFKGVISLDTDSEDDDNEPRKCQCHEKLNVLQSELTKCTFEKQMLENEVLKLREELMKLPNNKVPIIQNDVLKTEIDVPITQNDVPMTLNDVSVTQNDVPITQNDVQMTQNDISITRNYVPITQNDVPMTVNDVSITQNDVPITQNDVPITQNDISITKNDVPMTQNDVPIIENDVSITQNDVPITQNDVSMTQNDVSITQNDIPITQNDDSIIVIE